MFFFCIFPLVFPRGFKRHSKYETRNTQYKNPFKCSREKESSLALRASCQSAAAAPCRVPFQGAIAACKTTTVFWTWLLSPIWYLLLFLFFCGIFAQYFTPGFIFRFWFCLPCLWSECELMLLNLRRWIICAYGLTLMVGWCYGWCVTIWQILTIFIFCILGCSAARKILAKLWRQ